MTDIVERLKDCYTEWTIGDTRRWARNDMVALLPDAAAEIEQLRREVAVLKEQRNELIDLLAERVEMTQAPHMDKPC